MLTFKNINNPFKNKCNASSLFQTNYQYFLTKSVFNVAYVFFHLSILRNFLNAFCNGHILLIYKTAFRDRLNK